jgi:ubiquinone/menaquinone biosynthesis C-methylase UbiE
MKYVLMKKKKLNCEGESQAQTILPVSRTKDEAKRFYDRISKFYDYLTGSLEQDYARRALNRLSIEKGETVLEIGFGTGHCLKQMAERVGETGKVYGVDISSGMLKVTKRRLAEAGLMERVELHCGDAVNLPYGDDAFDAVFTSFTLELFDTPEIPKVLYEIKRVLKSGGRLGVVSMSKEDGRSIALRFYEWVHKKWPKYVDCRPIYVEKSLGDAGYEIKSKEKVRLFGLPGEIIVALNQPMI